MKKIKVTFAPVAASGRYVEFEAPNLYASIVQRSSREWHWYVDDNRDHVRYITQGSRPTREEAERRVIETING